ncbi:MAG TPA: lysoplasmalogenase, partial [Blastocatellia bacterium]|nr:lysoplasmalogenase [Blastocatellia bacterium]
MILNVTEFDTKWPPRPVDRLLLSVSVISAVAYLLSQTEPFAGSAVVKSLAVSPLGLIAISRPRDRDGFLLCGALLLSSVGDLLLGIDPDRLFVFGLAVFLIAHLLYITLFALNKNQPAVTSSNSEATVGAVLLLSTERDRPSPGRSSTGASINPSPVRDSSRRSPKAGAVRRLIAVVVGAYTASMLIWLWPSLGDLRIAVVVYICVITGMGVMSLLAGFRSWIVPLGALLFMLSDSLIAVGKFKHPVRYDNYLIWCTYYVGQVCITMGVLRYRERS